MDRTPAQQPVPALPPYEPPAQAYAPDWYDDPTHRFEFRYHNGQAWTGDVSSDGQRFLDPLSISAPPLQSLPSQQRTNGKAVAAFVLAASSVLVGWVPFLCVLAVVAAGLAVVFGFAALSRIRNDGHRKGRGLALAAVFVAPLGFAVSGVGIWLTVLTVREFDRYSNVGNYSIATVRCSVDSGIAHFDGTITNNSTTTRSYHLAVEFLRPGTSNNLYTTSVDVDDVAPAKSGDWSVTHSVAQEQLDCRVSAVTGPLPFAEGEL